MWNLKATLGSKLPLVNGEAVKQTIDLINDLM